VETLQGQFSGYGSTASVVARTLDKLGLKEPLEHWSDETIDRVVNAFTDEKFPTVIALNKIDHADADKNISKIAKMQDPKSIVLCSAISEVFLRKLAKQSYIRCKCRGCLFSIVSWIKSIKSSTENVPRL